MSLQPAALPRRELRARRKFFQQESVTGYLFVVPALLVIAIIAFYPIVQSLWFSLQSYLPTHPEFGSKLVGLDNYKQAFQDTTFTGAIGWTALFTVASVVFEFLLGLLFAITLNQKFVGRNFARAAVLVPWAFPTVISAVVWRSLGWQNNTGVIPAVFHALLPNSIASDWAPLASTPTLIVAMIAIDVWKTAPYMALLLLAGLQTISDEVYEAARVDGASVWQRFFSITLPLLKPAILVAVLFRTLDAWRVFDLFFVVAGSNLQSISTYAYNQLIVSGLNFPIGIAVTVMVFLTSGAIALFFIKVLGAQTNNYA